MPENNQPKVRIRMYRQGLGDCFLLTFFTGPTPVHMLVDCGTLGATTTGVELRDVVKNIIQETGGHLHLLVVTHEHKDHVSGFNTGRKLFDAPNVTVDLVWVAWTEDPEDSLAQQVAIFEEDLLASLQLTSNALSFSSEDVNGQRQPSSRTAPLVRQLLDFYGNLPDADTPLGADFAKTVHEAMNYASRRAGQLPVYLHPGRVIEPEWLPGVRFFVLGPPRDLQALRRLGDHDSPELYHLTDHLAADLIRSTPFYLSSLPLADYRNKLKPDARQEFETGLPFDPCFRIESGDKEARTHFFAAYDAPGEAWRRIDYDWLEVASDLALQLDNATNNTSLVLAIELIEDGRVLLLPADAQLGNWQSWEKVEFSLTEADGQTRTVKAADLLKRTVFYKVGHHASHNATLKEKGLEVMQGDDLVAMIPVDSAVAKNKGWQMPATALYQALLDKTHGRVLRSDTGWPGTKPEGLTEEVWQAIRDDKNIIVKDLYIEYWLQ
jgi:hypothetical protein